MNTPSQPLDNDTQHDSFPDKQPTQPPPPYTPRSNRRQPNPPAYRRDPELAGIDGIKERLAHRFRICLRILGVLAMLMIVVGIISFGVTYHPREDVEQSSSGTPTNPPPVASGTLGSLSPVTSVS
ncbi:hypothetical protein BDN72DRAFT_845388 [Pluteus cervinus]|uniref:Uncharacterized protein n=1 Tax=Pluteus cervinus TaxID=181527 RepID=A0ACD3AIJ5_9AGAR|nr:hypothetical protein BDN72DRAFT_845388 [Pluteus cervinus]